MMDLFKKDSFIPALLTAITGILMIVSGILSFLANAQAEISLCFGGVVLIVSAVMVFFDERSVRKYLVPASYLVLSVIYFVAMGLDASKKYTGLGLAAEAVTAVLFLLYAVIFVLREFKIYNSIWIKALEILLCIVQAACAFFVLFSTASFGYKYAKMSVSDSKQIFYILIAFLSYILLAIANTLYDEDNLFGKK